MLLRYLSVFCISISVGCASIDVAREDAGAPDGGFGLDAGPHEGGVPATACGPVDVSGYAPTPMHPPNPPWAGACTSQQISDFAACEAGDTSKCAEFGAGQSAEACGACIDTNVDAKTWGVLVSDTSSTTVNIEGCVDDALGQVSWEAASGGNGSCGDLLHGWYGCLGAACGACAGDDLATCLDAASAGGCAKWNDAVNAPDGPCAAALSSDASPPALDACFPDASITNAAAQRSDFLTRMANYMCGAQP